MIQQQRGGYNSRHQSSHAVNAPAGPPSNSNQKPNPVHHLKQEQINSMRLSKLSCVTKDINRPPKNASVVQSLQHT